MSYFQLTVNFRFDMERHPRGDVAQTGERGVRNAEVRGSIPLISTKIFTYYGVLNQFCAAVNFIRDPTLSEHLSMKLITDGCNHCSLCGSLLLMIQTESSQSKCVIVLHSDLLSQVARHGGGSPFFWSKNLILH